MKNPGIHPVRAEHEDTFLEVTPPRLPTATPRIGPHERLLILARENQDLLPEAQRHPRGSLRTSGRHTRHRHLVTPCAGIRKCCDVPPPLSGIQALGRVFAGSCFPPSPPARRRASERRSISAKRLTAELGSGSSALEVSLSSST